jgi:hypothetical protein
VLSWYKAVDLDELEHRRKGGLDGVNPAKLCRRACAIIECTDTDTCFDAGEGKDNEGVGDMDLEVSSFTGSTTSSSKDPANNLALPSPDATDFVLAARTSESPLSKPADTPGDS